LLFTIASLACEQRKRGPRQKFIENAKACEACKVKIRQKGKRAKGHKAKLQFISYANATGEVTLRTNATEIKVKVLVIVPRPRPSPSHSHRQSIIRKHIPRS
jgi:hypothetical protein